jgi:hypothetical protein
MRPALRSQRSVVIAAVSTVRGSKFGPTAQHPTRRLTQALNVEPWSVAADLLWLARLDVGGFGASTRGELGAPSSYHPSHHSHGWIPKLLRHIALGMSLFITRTRNRLSDGTL